MAGDYLLDYRAVLARVVFIHHVGVVYSYDGLIRRYLDDIKLIYCLKFLRLGRGGTGHTGELTVEAEIVLEGNGRKGLVLLLHVDVLLGLYRLMQTLGVAAAEHETSRKLIDNDYLAVLDDIIYIALHDAVRLERLIYMVRQRCVLDIRQIFQPEGLLRLGDASCGQRSAVRLFIDDIVCVYIVALLFLFIDRGIDDLF